MKRHRLTFVIAGVVLLHVAAFLLLSDYRPMPKREPLPEGTFEVRRSEVRDSATGRKTIYREYTVTTKLSDPEPRP